MIGILKTTKVIQKCNYIIIFTYKICLAVATSYIATTEK